ncbi:MAG TPA: hypothetical protein VHT25_12235, partial [Solirubrobacteraceae bacterium]|nr:hypothetical protein [Solirubrobacteraceae bacterium]
MGSSPKPPGRGQEPGQDSRRAGRLLFGGPLAVLAVAAAVVAVIKAGSAIEIISIAVLAVATIALGWRIGESRRTALEQEIDGRSH